MTIQALAAAIPALGASDAKFAASLLAQHARTGDLSPKQWPWVAKLVERATAPKPVAVKVGDMAGVIALFDRAKAHLKFPAIVLSGPFAGELRVNVAGPNAKVPGSINVCLNERDPETGRRPWFGRILKDGTYEPARDAPNGIAEHLARLAAEPAKVAAEHGLLTGRCCFCNRHLDDERSTAVGYGPVCAGHFGLPWGAKPEAFAAAAA